MKNINVAGAVAAPFLMFVMTLLGHAASTTPGTCKDGTATATTGRGACSGHGGVQKATAGTPAATPAPAAATASSGAPAGATAKCKDGTYSKSAKHSGSCSKHGGVDSYLAASP